MLSALLRAFPIRSPTALIVLVSLAVALVVSPIAQRGRPPVEKARTLAVDGSYAEADDAFLAALSNDLANVPLLLELVDNHARLVADVQAVTQNPEDDLARLRARDADEGLRLREERVAALFERLPSQAAMLAGHWRNLVRSEAAPKDRAPIVAAANAEPPMAWANHVLALEAQRSGDETLAAQHFAREARAFDGRREDAERACELWASRGDWGRVDEALEDARLANQLGPGARVDLAARRGEWGRAMRTFVPSQFADTTYGALALALVSAAAWLSICISVGGGRRSSKRTLVLYGIAVVLGILSTQLTVALILVETYFLPSLRSPNLWARIGECLIGVGPREEASKALMVLGPVLLSKRWGGGRREAVACGALVGLGFAAAENLDYFAAGLSAALLRFVTANFFHISSTGLVAAALDGALRGETTKGNGVGWTLAFVVVMHGLYDAFIVIGGKGAWVAVLLFALVVRRFLAVLRELSGGRDDLLPRFTAGMALVAGASFVYASALVGVRLAALSMASAFLGVGLVIAMFVRELASAERAR